MPKVVLEMPPVLDVAFAIPGDIDAPSGGYAYARKLFALLPEFGITPHHLELPDTFPAPSPDDLSLTRQLLDQLHPSTPVLFDGLAYGALPPGFLDGLNSPYIALVHHPLAFESGLEPERQRQLLISERYTLGRAKAVIATSPLTARELASKYDVAPGQITVAEPGTEPAIRAIGTDASPNKPFSMLAVGSLIPRKGYTVLIEALKELDISDWHLTIAGTPEHDPAEANRIREAVLASGKRRQITIAGRIPGPDLARLYAQADLFVMPSLYEGYGMVLAEAMARGLPIVCTTGGAAAETAPDAAAIKVPPGDAAALQKAIASLMDNEPERTIMSAASWAAGRKLPRWAASIEKIADVLKAVHKEQTS